MDLTGKNLKAIKKYATIKFFDYWGLERQGASKEQRIATIKFLNNNFNDLQKFSEQDSEKNIKNFKKKKSIKK